MYPKIKNKIVKRILISFFVIDYDRLKFKKKDYKKPELPKFKVDSSWLFL